MEKEDHRIAAQVEVAKQRCMCVIDSIHQLPSSSNITHSCRTTLLKLARAELAFLSRPSSSTPLSINIGHLEAVVHILQQPFISGVSRVCKSIPLSPSVSREERHRHSSSLKDIHVDVVCILNGKPVWIIVSDRNPKYISWNACHKSKGLKLRIQQVLVAAKSNLTLRPSSIIIFFANGIASHVYDKLRDEFGASEIRLEFSVFSSNMLEETEGDWINVIARSYRDACVLEINPAGNKNVLNLGCNVEVSTVDSCEADVSVGKAETRLHLLKENTINGVSSQPERSIDKAETRLQLIQEDIETKLGDTFCSVITRMKLSSLDDTNSESTEPGNLVDGSFLVNFDTTALIAFVSGISNGGTEKLLATPEIELRQRFKGNFDFVIGQIMSELQDPIHVEFGKVLCGKLGMICESVLSEFKELVLMCGGPNEKLRADKLINCLRVVPDTPSERMMGLPTTRKLALKNKIVFGTGDHYHAPTLTANMAFVRAVSQTGMSLSSIEHRPRALTGD